MLLRTLHYELDPNNIACEPREVRLGRRDLSRMLVVDRTTGRLVDSAVRQICDWLHPGDVLVINNSKRIPGVLKARVEGTAKVDVRIVSLLSKTGCLATIGPNHMVRLGAELRLQDGNALVVQELELGPHKLARLEASSDLTQSLKNCGFPITSFFYSSFWDVDNYNPVYAREEGSVESPMAGLHFTPELLKDIRAHGVAIGEVTLHVVGSWLPPLGRSTSNYAVYGEAYSVPSATAEMIATAAKTGKRVVAIGSTVVRTLETAAKIWDGVPREINGVSELFIAPGHRFEVVDAYFTNFHPAQSGLMALDAAFCDKELLLAAYAHANQASYAFLEFGDAVLYV